MIEFDFMDILGVVENFMVTGQLKVDTKESLWFCEDRSQVKGRLPHWYKLLETWTKDQNQAALISAILGELANNSFDHNLGRWTDVPGCLVGLSIQSETILLLVADRGQGIISSLSKQLPEKTSYEEAMRVAFEERISGRAPEQRGNGLKFVKGAMDGNKRRLYCFSTNTVYKYGDLSFEIKQNLLKNSPGTLTIVEWNLL